MPPEDVCALADRMSFLIGSEADRKRLSANASSVLERFGIDRVLDLWDNLIHRTGGGQNVAVRVAMPDLDFQG